MKTENLNDLANSKEELVLTADAYERLRIAQQEGLAEDETEASIVEILLDQECVSFCSKTASVFFDFDDITNLD